MTTASFRAAATMAFPMPLRVPATPRTSYPYRRLYGISPFRETRAYVARVLKFYRHYEEAGLDAD